MLLLIGKFYHEPWRDEIHALSICNAANSIGELYNLRDYEGHPILYFIIIYCTQLISKSLVCFIIVHGLAAIACMYLLIFKLIKNWFIQLLLITNYYFLFEFGIINRSYIFIFLALLLAIYLFNIKKNMFAYIVLIIGLQLHMQAMPLFVGAFAYYIFQDYKINTYKFSHLMLLALVFCSSVFVCYYSCKTTGIDADIATNIFPSFIENYRDILIKINIGSLTFFNFKLMQFWNVFIFWHWVPHVLLFTFFIIASIITISKNARIFYLATLILSIYFLFVIKGWGYRHYCFVWFTFFIFYLINNTNTKKYLHLILSIYLVPQAITGILAFYKDAQLPFSNSKPTASFINKLNTNTPIAACQAYTADGLAYYTHKPIYYLGNNETNTYIRWTKQHFINPEDRPIFEHCLENYLQKYPNGYLVLSKDAGFNNFKNYVADSTKYTISELYNPQTTSIVDDENFVIYAIKKR